jgi:hypothetical protein
MRQVTSFGQKAAVAGEEREVHIFSQRRDPAIDGTSIPWSRISPVRACNASAAPTPNVPAVDATDEALPCGGDLDVRCSRSIDGGDDALYGTAHGLDATDDATSKMPLAHDLTESSGLRHLTTSTDASRVATRTHIRRRPRRVATPIAGRHNTRCATQSSRGARSSRERGWSSPLKVVDCEKPRQDFRIVDTAQCSDGRCPRAPRNWVIGYAAWASATSRGTESPPSDRTSAGTQWLTLNR